MKQATLLIATLIFFLGFGMSFAFAEGDRSIDSINVADTKPLHTEAISIYKRFGNDMSSIYKEVNKAVSKKKPKSSEFKGLVKTNNDEAILADAMVQWETKDLTRQYLIEIKRQADQASNNQKAAQLSNTLAAEIAKLDSEIADLQVQASREITWGY